ncbi:MAG: methyltransferase [Leptospiraceae bacterium]|nr:methyltransferase [Leptospiraceae bacterium]
MSETGVVDYSKKISMLRIGEYVFEIPINGFFQVNRFLISNWIKEIRSLLPKTKVEFVELFSGCGLISISISDLILKSTCMEIDKKSIEFSKKNSIRNEKKNLKFIQSDLYSSQNNVENFSAKHWIVNPPRNGLGREIFRLFEKCKPELLIYSSCNYVTLARDLKFFFQLGYKITDISLFDFFPRTHYFETLVKIERK